MSDIVERLRTPASDDEWMELMAQRIDAAAEIERLRSALQWRPIETAPKDGTPIYLLVQYFNETPEIVVAAWDTTNPKWPWLPTCEGSAYSEDYVTHWMPLPPLPQEKTDE